MKDTIDTIKLLVIDVDGTMTDGGIYYDNSGNELKKFSTKDAAGFFAAHKAGIKLMVLTGRNCAATAKRMEELQVEFLFQNIRNKAMFLQEFMEENNLAREHVGYIGDDLNDLLSMDLAGFVGCPADSCREVLARADYVSSMKGGHGAVRDIIENILREKGSWENAVADLYGNGM